MPCVECNDNLTRRPNGLCTGCNAKTKKLKNMLLTENEINIIIQIRAARRPPSPVSSSDDEDEF